MDKESQRSNAEKEKVSAKEVQLSSKSSPELKEINEIKEPKKLIEHVQHAVQRARKDGLRDIDGHCEPLLGVRKAKGGRHRGSKTVTQLIKLRKRKRLHPFDFHFRINRTGRDTGRLLNLDS